MLSPSSIIALAGRELASYFRTPAGWIIIILFLVLTGLVFAFAGLTPGRPASMRVFFEVSGWLLLPVAPAISMRLFAEEFRTGTVETLVTSPLGSLSLVLGKYAGAMLFLVAMIAPTLAYVGVLMGVSDPRPDLGPIVSGYVLLLLLGGLYLGLGLLASSLTANATLAFIITLFLIIALLLVGTLGRFAPEGPVRDAAFALALPARVGDFAKGVIDTRHVVFFATIAAFCCVVATGLLSLRRWR